MSDDGTQVHIVGVQVSSIHRLRMAELELSGEGGLVRVTGKNKAGKSSLLRAIRMALGGDKQRLKDPVTEGTKSGKGWIKLELTNGYTVRKDVNSDGKTKLSVKGPDGASYKQGRLNELLGEHHDFDLLTFFSLKEAKQTEILFGLSPDKTLAAEVSRIRAECDARFAERTPHLSEQTRCRKIKEPFGERPERVDTSAAVEELTELTANQQARDETAADLDRAKETMRRCAWDADQKRAELEEAEAEHREVVDRVTALQAGLEETSDHSERIAEVQAAIAGASQVSEWLVEWDEFDRAQASLTEATQSAEVLTTTIEALRQEERETIARAAIPVDGLTVDVQPSAPMLNGRALDVASGAERIRMALDVAVAGDPDLKIALIDEANDLDRDSMAALEAEAKERNFQVWCCRLDEEGSGEIIVVDGKARTT